MTDEDLIADEDVVVTISGRGYIKRQPVATYRRQHRGGKGIIGHVTREEDAVEHLLVANTHDWALFFTNRGRVFSSKVHAIPDASRQAKGMPIINLPGVQVEAGRGPDGDDHAAATSTPGRYLVMATRQGIDQEDAARAVRAGPLDRDPRDHPRRGRRARLGRRLDRPRRHHPRHRARARSPGSTRPRSGRWAATAGGVIGIRLARKGDAVVSMSVVQPDADLLVLTETGYGKRVAADRVPGRSTAAARASGSSPSRAARPATWPPSSRSPRQDEELLLISSGGQVVRTETNTINRYSSRRARRDRDAPRRGRPGRRDRRLPGGAGGAGGHRRQ